MPNEITIKIFFTQTQQTKTLRFPLLTNIEDVLEGVREKVPGAGGDDFGLFRPSSSEEGKGTWLKLEKTLQFYDIHNQEQLQFRKKHAPVKIQLLDESMKTVMADFSQPVDKLVETMCKKIGISNPEEFSLKTGKMAEKDWLNGTQSLHEQGVQENYVLLLKKKFFFSDANVDVTDPVELHLLYVQAVKQITEDEYPTTQEQAVSFASIQLQVTVGNFVDGKHKPGFLKGKLKDYLPPQYVKTKNVEKQIFAEHRKLVNTTELNAKYRYLSDCRALKTYGVTQYKVQEVIKGKKKTKPVILGITRESVLRLEAESRKILTHYPLTHLRRWAAAANTFTLDFGDYEKDYFTFQTSEGEQMSQLIAGYIDIILKKRREGAARKKKIDDEEMMAEEESVGGAKAQAISSVGVAGQAQQAQVAQVGSAQGAMMVGQGASAQSALHAAGTQGQSVAEQSAALKAAEAWRAMASTTDFEAALQNVQRLGQDLDSYTPGSGQRDLDSSFEVITQAAGELAAGDSSQMSLASKVASMWKSVKPQDAQQHLTTSAKAVAAATAKLVQGSVRGANYGEVMQAAQGVTQATADLVQACKACAGVTRGVDHKAMVIAAQEMAKATALVVSSAKLQAQAAQMGTRDPKALQDLVAAAKAIGAATTALVQAAMGAFKAASTGQGGPPPDPDAVELAQNLIDVGKAVAQATEKVLITASDAAKTMKLPAQKQAVADTCKEAASATRELANQIKQTADAAILGQLDESSPQLLMAAARSVGTATTAVVTAVKSKAQEAGTFDPTMAQGLADAAKTLATAINQLVACARKMAEDQKNKGPSAVSELQAQLRQLSEGIDKDIEQMHGSQGNMQGILNAAKSVASHSAQFVAAARQAATKTKDTDFQKRLLEASQAVATATSALVAAVKAVATNQNDPQAIEQLKIAAMGLQGKAVDCRNVVDTHALILASKQYANAATQSMTVAKAAVVSAPPAYQQQFVASAKPAAVAISQLVQAGKNPENTTALLEATKQALSTSDPLVQSVRGLETCTTDPEQRPKLTQAAQTQLKAQEELETAVAVVEASSSVTEQDIAAIYNKAQQAVAECVAVMALATNPAATQAELEDVSQSASRTAQALEKLVHSAAGKSQDLEMRGSLGNGGTQISRAMNALVAAGSAAAQPAAGGAERGETAANDVVDVTDGVKDVCNAVSTTVAGLQTAFPAAPPALNDESALQAMLQAAEAGASTSKCPGAIASAARQLSQATAAALWSARSQGDVIGDARSITATSTDLCNRARDLGGALGDDMLRDQLMGAAKSVSDSTSKVINAARLKLSDPVAAERFNMAAQDLCKANTEVVVAASIAAGDVSPDDEVVSAARLVTKSTGNIARATASNDKRSIVEGAKQMVSASQQLNSASKQLASRVDHATLRAALINAAKTVMECTTGVISAARTDLTEPQNAQSMNGALETMNAGANSTLHAAQECAAHLRAVEEKVDDPIEQELLNAAKALEGMAGELAKVREASKQAPGDGATYSLAEQELNEKIYDSAHNLAKSCVALMKSAQASQREVSALHKAAPSSQTYLQDPKVVEGLVGGAKSVAGAISLLVEAANQQATGQASEERMIAAARGCNAATVQILSASRAKCKTGSANQLKLSGAAKLISQASQQLVATAKDAASSHAQKAAQMQSAEEIDGMSFAETQRAELDAQAKVLELQRQLDAARNQVKVIRKDRYAGAQAGPSSAVGGLATAQGVPSQVPQLPSPATTGQPVSQGYTGYAAPPPAAAPYIPAPITGGYAAPPPPMTAATPMAPPPIASGSGGAQCKECSCVEFEPHPFKRKQCRNCFHEH